MAAVSVSLSGVEQVRQLFGDRVVQQAMNSALNKIAAQGKTLASKEIRQTYNVKARDLSKQISVRKSRANDFESIILATGPRLSLMYFDPEQTVIRGTDAIISRRSRDGGVYSVKRKAGSRARGVTVRVANDRGRKLVKGRFGHGGFMAPGRRGQRGPAAGAYQIFERVMAKTWINGQRTPIEKKTGPAVAQMHGKKKGVIEEFIKNEAGRILNHELDFFVSRLRSRG